MEEERLNAKGAKGAKVIFSFKANESDSFALKLNLGGWADG